MRSLLLYLSLGLLVGLCFSAAQEMTSNGNIRTNPRTLVSTESEQVLHGADVYFESCAVCHGDTALGLAEAKTTFPESHQRCTRCHRPGNPKTVDWTFIQDTNMFDLGDPVALRGDGALAAFANAAALHAYTSATMPRYAPGTLDNSDYLAVTAFLLHVNGALPEGLELTGDNAVDISLP